MALKLWAQVHSTSCLVGGWIATLLSPPCLGSTAHPAMPIRHFGKGHSQDLFDLLLCPAFTSQISQVAAGPEDQRPERRREGLPVKSHSNEQPL